MRVEVGPRDVQQGACVMARRDRPGKEGKMFGVPMEAGAFIEAVQVPHCADGASRPNSHVPAQHHLAGNISSVMCALCSQNTHSADIDIAAWQLVIT